MPRSASLPFVSLEEAVSVIKSRDRVFVHSIAAAPQQLIRALTARSAELRDVQIVHIHTEGHAPYSVPELSASFHTNAMFVGSNIRSAVDSGEADYIPVFLSEIPALFRRGALPLDAALVHVSPPDKHGFCSLGVSVDASLAAVQTAKYVIAQVNPNMPRIHGDGMIHVSEIDYAVETDDPIPELHPAPLSPAERAIGDHCAALIDDGATLQMGIGAIPGAVLNALRHHRDLGIHTEMFTDGVIDLIESGVVNGARKKVHPGKIVSSFVWGSRRLYNFVDDNPLILLRDVAFVNDTAVIRVNPNVVAINSAIEVDLTGQISADSIGVFQYSGVGGQMDFIRGASLSEGGKPIIALPSTTSNGLSRIATYLMKGASVVTTRAHVHYVVTEYGVANLYGKNLRQRARALIDIAHPNHRENLEREALERFKRFRD